LEVPEPTFCPSTLLIVTAIKLPGRNEKAHTLESAEIVACALGVLALLALLESMFCVAHAGKIIAAKTGKRHFIERKVDSPKSSTTSFWKGATAHRGVTELRAKRGRPRKAPHERKEQIALRLDADVLAWYRAQGSRWQTRMNAVLKAYRDATI
jgi:uncharacterized protein (DUF4415 family)